MMAFPRIRKKYMTIMEVLIAMMLTVALLTTLTYFYRHIEVLSEASEKLQKQSFQKRYTGNRLLQVFATTVPDYNFKKTNLARAFCVFTSGDLHGLLQPGTDSLVFMYNNQARADGADADVLLARLFVDRKGRLCLASWTPPYEWVIGAEPPRAKLEILMENVETLDFTFFVPPKKEREILQNAINEREHYYQTLEPTAPAVGGWIKHWEKEYNRLPPMVKIFVRQKFEHTGEESETNFAFSLPYAKELIMYEQ